MLGKSRKLEKSVFPVSDNNFAVTEFIEEIPGKIHIKKIYSPICFLET